MAKYVEYWNSVLKKLKKQLRGDNATATIDVQELTRLGERELSGYNGFLKYWAQTDDGRTSSQVFNDLHDAVVATKFLNTCPGLLEFRIRDNNTLHLSHRLLQLVDLVERYKTLQGTSITLEEKYKWQLIQRNLDRWQQYEEGELTFKQYLQGIEFRNLLFHLSGAVLRDVEKHLAEIFEKQLRALYDESRDLQERITTFKNEFSRTYRTLPSAGANSFMDDRTVALFLAFRFPDRYTIFKESFYSKLCKAMGRDKPNRDERLVHYYSIVKELIQRELPLHPDVIAKRDAMLDETCYPDPQNMILAQDIFYTTTRSLETPEADEEQEEISEQQFLNTLSRLPEEMRSKFLRDVHSLLGSLGVRQGDQRIAFSVRRRWLALTIGQRYCYHIGRKPGEKHGFIISEAQEIPDTHFGQFSGKGDPYYGQTENYDRVHEFWDEIIKASRAELERTTKSSYRDTSNQFFENAVFDEAYRRSILGKDAQVTVERSNPTYALNTIMYGPPGTGKTYGTVAHAVAVIENVSLPTIEQQCASAAGRSSVRERYERYRQSGQIRMITFHQSVSYEDFIEGIKPQMITTDGVANVSYEVQDGIFKSVCQSGRSSIELRSKSGHGRPVFDKAILDRSEIWKVGVGDYKDPEDDAIFDYCMEHDVFAMGYGGDVDLSGARSADDISDRLKENGQSLDGRVLTFLRYICLDMKEGDIVFASEGNGKVRAIGQVSGGYFMDVNAPIRYKQFRRVKWLYKDLELPVADFYDKQFTQGTLWRLKKELFHKDYFLKTNKDQRGEEQRFVLIIDEINRGNVAGIFGELITLIEPDKRAGNAEAATTVLPYSKQPFSIPPNLHIIGTMNTADRSVEALDTALRRRFSFVECPSRPELLRDKKAGGIDLEQLLATINARIEMLLDRDHHIGHSYFMNWNGSDPELRLRQVFKNNIIPLLQEYFYGDPVKVGLVLGEAFVVTNSNTVKLAKFKGADDIEPKTRYRLVDPLEKDANGEYVMGLEAFQEIIGGV